MLGGSWGLLGGGGWQDRRWAKGPAVYMHQLTTREDKSDEGLGKGASWA